MKGVCKLRYIPDLDRRNLLSTEICNTLPQKAEEVGKSLACYLDEARSLTQPDSDIHLGFFFSNSYGWRTQRVETLRKYAETPTVIVFPLHEEQIRYTLTEKSFWCNRGNDPVIIRASFAAEQHLHEEQKGWKLPFSDYLLFCDNITNSKYHPYVQILTEFKYPRGKNSIPWALAEVCFETNCLLQRIKE